MVTAARDLGRRRGCLAAGVARFGEGPVSILHAAFKRLLEDGQMNPHVLAKTCECTIKELLTEIGSHRDFVRVAGTSNCWEWNLDRTARVMAEGNQLRADRETKAAFAAQPRAERYVAPVQPHPRQALLVRYKRGWRGRDGSPSIVVALTQLGDQATVGQIAAWCDLPETTIYTMAKRAYEYVRVVSRRPAIYALRVSA